jgi:5,10-methylenetetrahydromethanopterin reductase
MPELQIGAWVAPAVGNDAAETVELEREGFDVALYGDSQTIFEDPYVRMANAAARTSRIRVAPGIGAPVTRDASIIASCAASVHAESGGRALLCLGSGDSAIAAVGGRPPLPVAEFEREVAMIRRYLRGEAVDRSGAATRLHWIPPELPPVEVDVSATGPRTIAMAARVADRVTFNVGSEPERVQWAADVARAEREDARLGAWITVGVGEDEEALIDGMRAVCAVHARFPKMGGGSMRAVPEHARAVASAVDTELLAFEGTRIEALKAASARVDDEFVRWHATLGDAEAVTARLQQLVDIGLSHLYLVFGDPNTDVSFMKESRQRFAGEVMPALRAAGVAACR